MQAGTKRARLLYYGRFKIIHVSLAVSPSVERGRPRECLPNTSTDEITRNFYALGIGRTLFADFYEPHDLSRLVQSGPVREIET